MPRWSKLVAAIAIVAAFVGAAAARYRPPAAKSTDAPGVEFSAGRAREKLRALVGDGHPHPAGSAAAARVREGIAAELQRLGYRPELQERFACGAIGICGGVTNVLARVEGTRPGKAVLLSVHYDSVAAGPGASDDGLGVAAALEVARALKADPAPANPIVLLFNEGEEDDLLGAEVFVAGHAWAREVGAVVNLEARGTAGASLMFETSDRSAWLVDTFAASASRPASNSIYYTIYKLLPNDTDLTVYKRGGLLGLNFAVIAGEARYHTPRDDFAHADPDSLQHHGDNALAMVRALSRLDLASPARAESVFFDLLAFGVVRWPLGWMKVLALAAAILWLAGTARAVRRGELRPGAAGWGVAAFLAAPVATCAAAYALLAVLRAAGAVPYPFVAHPSAARAAFLVLPVVGSWLAALWPGRRAGAAGLFWGTWAGWTLAGLVAAFASPGLSYPFVLPSLVAALCGLAVAAHARWLASVLPLAVAALLWCPVAWLLYDALGVPILPVSSALLALVLGTAAQSWLEADARFRGGLAFVSAALVVTTSVAAVAVAPFSVDNPRKQNLWYRLDADTGRARWLASAGTGPLLPQLAAAAPFERSKVSALEWAPRVQAWAAPAPALPLTAPELRIEEQRPGGKTRLVRARLRSPRGAALAGIAVPAARAASMRMNGVLVPLAPSKNRAGAAFGDAKAYRGYVCATMPREGVEIELQLLGDTPAEVFVWDASPGLPEQGAALLSARPAWVVPFQTGDRTLVVAKTVL